MRCSARFRSSDIGTLSIQLLHRGLEPYYILLVYCCDEDQIAMDVIEWIFQLFDEIEEPTVEERIEAVSLLTAEVESWTDSSTSG